MSPSSTSTPTGPPSSTSGQARGPGGGPGPERRFRGFRVLRRLIVMDLIKSFTYRGDMMLFGLSGLAAPVISLLIWQAALLSGASFPVDDHYLATYFVMLGLVSMLTSSWMSMFLATEIRLGDLSRWLMRPVSGLLAYIANNIAEKAVKLLAVVPAVALLWLLFRDVAVFPTSPLVWLMFTLSVVLALMIVLAIDIMVASLAFWMDDVAGFASAKIMIASILSGTMVPLALMPEGVRGVVEVQPWRFTVSFPIEIVTGGLSGSDLAVGFGLQVGYTVTLWLGALALWRRGLRSYTAVGA